MLREFLHIESIKHAVEQGINCWLTYAMAQPVNFNIAIIALFLIQYTGLDHVKELIGYLKSEFVRIPASGN